jgi:CelD/BcsL family acetyltransferase involved in cellulose biosynthesis
VGLKIEKITTENAFHALEGEWRALEPQLLPVPFTSYDWNVSWWKHMHSERKAVTDTMFVLTFRDDSNQLRGVAPLMITYRPATGPLRLGQLQFFGADQNITEMRGIAASVADSAELYTTMLDYVRQHPQWDFMKLTGMPASTLAKDVVEKCFPKTQWTRELFNFYLVLKPTWEEFKTGLSRNIKESLRKCANAPKRDGLNFTSTVVQAQSDVRPALDEFFRLHAMRSQLTDTIAHPNVFAETNAREFLIEVCERYAARNALRIFQLRNDDKVIATRIGLISGDSVYFYYSGYDTEFSKYSVMTTVVAEAIKYCIEAGFKTINLSTGRDVSKERWSPSETLYLEAEFSGPGLAARFKHGAYRTAGKLIGGTRLRTLFARRAK